MDTEKGHRGLKKGLKIGLGIFLGLWAVVIVVLQVVLNSGFLTKNINRIAAEYVDGSITFGRVSASMFRSFPNLNLEIDDFSVVYPHDRFADFDSLGIYGRLLDAGRGAESDTLMSFRNLSVSVNYVNALAGKISIGKAVLDRARIFVHSFDEENANLNIFRFAASEEDADTSAIALPDISVRHLALTGKPHIVFTSQSDTVYAAMNMAGLSFGGKLDAGSPDRSRIGLSMDSLRVVGRLPADSLLFSMPRLNVDGYAKDGVNIGAEARVAVASSLLGRLVVPVSLGAKLSFPEGRLTSMVLDDIDIDVATLDITGNAAMDMWADSSYIRAELSLNDCPVQKTLETFCSRLMPEAMRLKTSATVSFTALCDGWYHPDTGALPELVAEMVIPKSSVAYEGLDYKGEIALDLNAETDRNGILSIILDNMDLYLAGIGMSASGSVEDPFCDDPLIDLELLAEVSLDDAAVFLPEGLEVEGNVSAYLSGMILKSDMSMYNFSRADLEGYIDTDGISFRSMTDSLSADIGKTKIVLEKAGKDAHLGAEILGFRGEIDNFRATVGKSLSANGKGVTLTAQNASETFSQAFGQEHHPIVGTLNAERISMRGSDSLRLGIRSSRNSFKLSNRRENGHELPILALTSDNGRISVRSGVTRIGLRDARFDAAAVMSAPQADTVEHAVTDPLAAKYMEDDFSASEKGLGLDKAVGRYLTGWNLGGRLGVRRCVLATPYFPLRNIVSGVGGRFDNNSVSLDSITIRSGTTDLSATGNVRGLTDAIAHGGVLDMDLNVTSKRINANELLSAYAAGSNYVPDSRLAGDDDISEEEYLESMVAADSLAVPDTLSPLFVLPRNIRANISLQGDRIDYSKLEVDWFSSDIALRDRTLQITNTVATSNMGDVYLEGFYSTRAKDDITAGFDINMVDITADKLVDLIPAVDTLVPLLKSFKGNLDCEVAATTMIDTSMNIIVPSINGVMKVAGRELSIDDDEALKKISRILMFKDRKRLNIADMSVQGIINDNELEVFPFVLGVDRYKLALSGLQNFDKGFDYHVSILDSPLPFKFGISLTGNFDDWKWRVCKARYKDANVPVFTKELHDMHYSLVGAIHDVFDRGVAKALEATRESMDAVEASKREAGYDARNEVGALDEGQKSALDSLRFAYEHPDSVLVDSAAVPPEIVEELVPEQKPRREKFFQRCVDRFLDRLNAWADRRMQRKLEKAERKAVKAAEKAEKKAAKEARKAQKNLIQTVDYE